MMQNRYRTDAASMFGYRPHPTLSYRPHPTLRAPLPLEGRGAATAREQAARYTLVANELQHSLVANELHGTPLPPIKWARLPPLLCAAAPRPYKGRGQGWGL